MVANQNELGREGSKTQAEGDSDISWKNTYLLLLIKMEKISILELTCKEQGEWMILALNIVFICYGSAKWSGSPVRE